MTIILRPPKFQVGKTYKTANGYDVVCVWRLYTQNTVCMQFPSNSDCPFIANRMLCDLTGKCKDEDVASSERREYDIV